MDDTTMTFSDCKKRMDELVREREWGTFHSPKNLSMAIASEAAELMEFFLWVEAKDAYDEVERHRQLVENELADIILATCAFANRCNIDIARSVIHKLQEIKAKYPVEKSKGHWTKYTKL